MPQMSTVIVQDRPEVRPSGHAANMPPQIKSLHYLCGSGGNCGTVHASERYEHEYCDQVIDSENLAQKNDRRLFLILSNE